MRKINVSYSKLVQVALNLSNTMQRDWESFEKAGITVAQFDSFKQNVESLSLDFDQIYEFPKLQLSARKTEKENELKAKLRLVFVILNKAFKLQNGVNALKVDAVASYNQDRIYYVAKMVVNIMRINMAMLSEFNITESTIAELETLSNEYLEIKIQRDAAIQLREIATYERSVKINAVYSDMQFFAQIGKAIYSGNDMARYNDYVLGLSTQSTATVPETSNEETPPDIVELDEIPETDAETNALNS